MHVIDVVVPTRFEVNCLPDAARVAVALFACEPVVAAFIFHADNEVLRHAELQVGRQFEFERCIASFMRSEVATVEPRFGSPVRCADYQENTFAPPRFGDGDLPRVPGGIPEIGHARKRGTPWERDVDRMVESAGLSCLKCFLCQCFVKCESPRAVEIDPFGPFEIRTRMFRQRNFCDGAAQGDHSRQCQQAT